MSKNQENTHKIFNNFRKSANKAVKKKKMYRKNCKNSRKPTKICKQSRKPTKKQMKANKTNKTIGSRSLFKLQSKPDL